jgi:hypothetical protein
MLASGLSEDEILEDYPIWRRMIFGLYMAIDEFEFSSQAILRLHSKRADVGRVTFSGFAHRRCCR